MRFRVLAALCPLAASVPAFGAPSVPRAASVAVLAVDGKGHGHGVGMAQDGAFWMAKAGATTNAILGHFYPGTALGHATGQVKVTVLTSTTRDAMLAFPNGGQVRDGESGATSTGFPISVPPGGQVRVWFDGGRYFASQPVGASPRSVRIATDTAPQLLPPTPTTTLLPRPRPLGPTTTTAPPPTLAPPPTAKPPPTGPPPASSTRELWAAPVQGATVEVPSRQRRYRGAIEVLGGGGLQLVNHLDVEQYLLGMGEVRDPSWPAAALRAQAIVARTYALRGMAASGELCDTDRCQVYLGEQAEYGAMTKAVADTRGRVVVYGLGLASTVYSSNGGGMSATPEEGFGTSAKGYPYLRAAPYTTSDPDPWTVRVGFTDVAARFAYKGEVSAVRVSKVGPSGRAIEVILDGSAGLQPVDGARFANGLGLRSTLFAFRVEQADTAPPAPAPGDLLQAPPDQLASAGSADAPATALTTDPRHPSTAGVVPRPSGGTDRRLLIVLSALALVVVGGATANAQRPGRQGPGRHTGN